MELPKPPAQPAIQAALAPPDQRAPPETPARLAQRALLAIPELPAPPDLQDQPAAPDQRELEPQDQAALLDPLGQPGRAVVTLITTLRFVLCEKSLLAVTPQAEASGSLAG